MENQSSHHQSGSTTSGYDSEKISQSVWKIPEALNAEEKKDTSSTSSFFSSSNFTMSCSGGDTQEENEPSTSGCSSFLAHTEKERNKAKKKERVKEYLKELKSIVQTKGEGRVGTLSTLQHVLSSMRKIKDAKDKSRTEKKVLPNLQNDEYMGPPADQSHTVYESDSHDSLTCESLKSSDELRIILSSNDQIVRAVSTNMKYVLGYPKDSWIGRSFEDYVHKKDLITFKSFHRMPEESGEGKAPEMEVTGESKIFYFRLRKFKSLASSGFSLRKQDMFTPFQCTFSRKKMTSDELTRMGSFPSWYESTSANSGSPNDFMMSSESSSSGGERPQKPAEPKEIKEQKLYTIMYCVPLMSPYSQSGCLPEVKSFETRQNLFCSFCLIQPNTIPLLGYLPQEMIGVSIFEFFHTDDLARLYNIFSKVIALKGVPYKSGPIRFLAKNGCWISCVTEWSSFVNPWSKRLEFIIGKHTVVKGPDNIDVFSENFHVQQRLDDSEVVKNNQQRIKDLLLQPVETVYLGNLNNKDAGKSGRKTVAIVEEKVCSDTEQIIPATELQTIYASEREKSTMHGTGVIMKENYISRAYEQLNYTNCIKKFLLSQPRSFSSDSDVKKSSSEDGFDEEMTSNSKSIEKWLATSIDELVATKTLHRTSDDSRSLPALNDDFWKKRIILSDSDFDFDISVPKPPSFGSSTRVLVSEQEHRDNEPLLDHMTLRDQLQLPSALVDANTHSSPQISREMQVTTDSPPIMTLTRESLWKHTILQEQLYIATASPERNILFVNEQRDMDYQCGKRQRHSLKRSHSPDHSSMMDRCKTGRHSTDSPPIPTTRSILNPILPIISSEMQHNDSGICKNLSSSSRMMVPMQMFPIVSIQSSTNASMDAQSRMTIPSDAMPGVGEEIPGMTFKPRVMVGYHQSMHGQPRMPVGLPLPVHQLNSFVMQQATSMVPKAVISRPLRKQQENSKGKNSSSESSSTEEAGLSFYFLESSEKKIKLAYNHLVMQSLARQLSPTKGLDPAPWLQKVPFPEGLIYRYHMYRSKNKRQLKKDREELEKITQPDGLMNQFEELLGNISLCNNGPLRDQENEYLYFTEMETGERTCCSCVRDTCCKELPYNDHGISDAMKALRKYSKKNDKRVKKSQHSTSHQNVSVQTEDFVKMEVDSDPGDSGGNSLPEPEPMESPLKSKTESCSSKSDSGDGDIRCYTSSDSIHSSNNSDLTPSDQRSNNENGSSLKESDGDAMSKKSDSSSSEKHLASSESESEMKNKTTEDFFSKLFTSSDICFPHLHRDCAPWLLDVEFNDDLKMKYHLETKDADSVLMSDKSQLEDLDEPDLVKAQLSALMEELGDSNLELVSIMSSGDPGTVDMEGSDNMSGKDGTSVRL